jgi:hypothetical protein
MLTDDLEIRIFDDDTGDLIRELILDPTRDYQPQAGQVETMSGHRCKRYRETSEWRPRTIVTSPHGGDVVPRRLAEPDLTGVLDRFGPTRAIARMPGPDHGDGDRRPAQMLPVGDARRERQETDLRDLRNVASALA